MKIQLIQIAHGRSGDKGNIANIGVIARRPEYYALLEKNLTAERVADHFAGICLGRVERFELPNLGALNFVLRNALDGGGTRSLRNDAQGKTLSNLMLRMEIEIPHPLIPNL
jgi:hypothetical protein